MGSCAAVPVPEGRDDAREASATKTAKTTNPSHRLSETSTPTVSTARPTAIVVVPGDAGPSSQSSSHRVPVVIKALVDPLTTEMHRQAVSPPEQQFSLVSRRSSGVGVPATEGLDDASHQSYVAQQQALIDLFTARLRDGASASQHRSDGANRSSSTSGELHDHAHLQSQHSQQLPSIRHGNSGTKIPLLKRNSNKSATPSMDSQTSPHLAGSTGSELPTVGTVVSVMRSPSGSTMGITPKVTRQSSHVSSVTVASSPSQQQPHLHPSTTVNHHSTTSSHLNQSSEFRDGYTPLRNSLQIGFEPLGVVSQQPQSLL